MGALLSAVILAAGFHHGEADPTLLGWIMTALSHILLGTLGFTELTVVIIIGIIILAMPALIVDRVLGKHAGEQGIGQRRRRAGEAGRKRRIGEFIGRTAHPYGHLRRYCQSKVARFVQGIAGGVE